MKELFEDIKLSRVSYLLEIIQNGNIDEKIKAFNKLEKYKITKKIGLLLIENSKRNYGIDDDFGGISSSLIELCFNEYYDEYTLMIENIFKYLNDKAKTRVLYLLTTIDNEGALRLYSELVLKYFSDKVSIPIGNLQNKPIIYTNIFPKLYKALKFKNIKNNILILISNYLNAGVVPKEDINKNKKLIIDSICNIFKEALKYNFKDTFSALNNKEYKELRYFLEIAANIEIYVSNKRTREYLNKLYKKHDNQLNLFILDNYIRSNTDITKINLNPICKDLASRYALFELLYFYEKENLISKKYLDKKLLAESDFYTNFAIATSYNYEAKDIKFYKLITIENLDYYVFKFKCTYRYSSISNDYVTNYICENIGINKYNGDMVTDDFIGVSGGYRHNENLIPVTANFNKLPIKKITNNDDIDIEIDKLLHNTIRDNINEKKVTKSDDKSNNVVTEEKVENKSIYSCIFTYFLLFLFLVFVILLVYCVLYVYNIVGIKDRNDNTKLINSVQLNKEYTFEELNGSDIFNKSDSEYYVLLFTKTDKKKSQYYNYINKFLKYNIKCYYVDLDRDENKFLYTDNDFNFTLNGDRLLKVKDHEYEYYVDGKTNILNEMELKVKEIENLNKQNQSK